MSLAPARTNEAGVPFLVKIRPRAHVGGAHVERRGCADGYARGALTPWGALVGDNRSEVVV